MLPSQYGVSAGKRDQIDKIIFFEIINVLDQMIKSTSILLKNFFLKKISIWSLFPALTPYEKRIQLHGRLCTVAYLATFRVLYQQGYIVVRGTTWYNILKWLQNPEFYLIDKKYNFENIIKISDCVKYRGKSVEIERICRFLPSEFLYYINRKDDTVDLSDLDNNSELVRRIFQIRP